LGVKYAINSHNHQALAVLKSDQEDQPLIEEYLRAQLQEAEKKLLREGSYLHNQDYGFVEEIDNIDQGFGAAQEVGGNVLIQGIAFLGPNNPSSNNYNLGDISKNRSGIVEYEVQIGDTPSSIAAAFGISTNTLLWANDLNYWSIIRPGDKLEILPTSGVVHEVKSGESLSAIVNKYDGELEETIAYNGLPANASLDQGQEVIIPGGEKSTSYYYRPRRTYYHSSYYGAYGAKSRQFPWGQCTWYVAQKRYIPWSGHAKSWLYNAQAMGYSVCWGSQCQPRPGAIVSLYGSGWLSRLYGHVAYVEAVSNGWFTISEMNHAGLGVRTVRTIPTGSGAVAGFIY